MRRRFWECWLWSRDCALAGFTCHRAALVILFLATLTLGTQPLGAAIVIQHIFEIPDPLIGSGNGTLDVRLFTFSGSNVDNSKSGFDFDNAVTDLPNGGGADINSFAESYFTTFGEIKSFYTFQFPLDPPDEIVLLLDLNETGAVAQATNHMDLLNIYLNPTVGSLDPVNNDIDSSTMSGINQVFTGGTLLAELQDTPFNLNIVAQGAGAADFVIFTGINPFDYNDSDTVLFNLSMSVLNNGAEEVFLSGTFSADDIRDALPIPEPTTASTLGWALLALALLGKVKGRSGIRHDKSSGFSS